MKAEQLRKSILQLAIQGKLVPQDPSDEPASVLLERIRAEKQRLIKQGKIKKDKGDSVIFKGDDNCYYEKTGSEVKNITDEIPFDIPDSWIWSRIRECYDIRNGFTPLRTDESFWNNGTIPWFTVEDIRSQGKEILETKQYITEKAITADRIVPANSFLLCCTASIGTYAQTRIELTTNQQFNALTVKDLYRNLLSDDYLFGIGDYFSNLLHVAAGKTTFEFVSVKKLGSFLIPIPPKAEQERIVAEIEKFEPLIAEYNKLEQQATKLDSEIYDKLKKSILQYAIQGKLVPQDSNDEPAAVLLERIRAEKKAQLGKKYVESYIYKGDDNCYYEKVGKNEPVLLENLPFDIPDSWCWARLGTIGDWGAGATPSRSNPEYYNGNIPWIKTGELNDGYIYSSEETITEQALQKCSLRYNKIGDVLIAMYGATIGKLAIAGVELTTNQACCACTPYKGLSNIYLFYFLKEEKDRFIKLGAGGAQPNISREKIVNYLIPIPPYNEQLRICNQIEIVLDKLKDEN